MPAIRLLRTIADLSAAFKKRRLARGIQQHRLAGVIALSRTTVVDIESAGKPRVGVCHPHRRRLDATQLAQESAVFDGASVRDSDCLQERYIVVCDVPMRPANPSPRQTPAKIRCNYDGWQIRFINGPLKLNPQLNPDTRLFNAWTRGIL